jgi:hypothetical protein
MDRVGTYDTAKLAGVHLRYTVETPWYNPPAPPCPVLAAPHPRCLWPVSRHLSLSIVLPRLLSSSGSACFLLWPYALDSPVSGHTRSWCAPLGPLSFSPSFHCHEFLADCPHSLPVLNPLPSSLLPVPHFRHRRAQTSDFVLFSPHYRACNPPTTARSNLKQSS